MLKQICTSKPPSLLIGYPSKPLNCTFAMNFKGIVNLRTKGNTHLFNSRNSLIEVTNVGVFRTISTGLCPKKAVWDYHQLVVVRGLSSSSSKNVGGGGGGNTLPWLAKSKSRRVAGTENAVEAKGSRSSWQDSAERFLKGGGASTVENKEMYRSKSGGSSYKDKGDNVLEEGGEDVEEFDDPRWDKIRNRYNRNSQGRSGSDRPEFSKWSKQESWGRKTWKEATEPTVPKLIGEGIYGVGPVLAVLLAGRRELYALYVQEALDLSGNNRKKKDKKGFEKILRMADKIGLTKKEVSKHDLNMVADNRPHQGLVLDASPLEMVGVKELEPVPVDDEHSPLWVALDEVTDPQNLGAIIRSAYFFGAAGVVLCAKNSAPLSGVVSKASAGSLELMELRSCKNMMQFLTSSTENGWRVLGGSVASRAVPLHDVAPGSPTILVLGSEGTGLRPLVERSCTQLVKIPGNAPVNLIAENAETEHECSSQEFRSFMAVESLNVSVAAGVLLHHLIGSNCRHHSHVED